MPLLIPIGFAHCAMTVQLTGLFRPALVTFGTEVPTGSDFTAVANSICDAFTDTLVGRFGSGTQLGPVTCRFGTDEEPLTVVSTLPPVPGSLSGAQPPPNVAVLVNLRTERGGRRGRGRMFLPWAVTETNVAEDGTMLPATVAPIQTAITSWLTRMNTDGIAVHILHNSEGNSAPGSPSEVTGSQVMPLVASQRRRLGR